jgi:hypothetical protein
MQNRLVAVALLGCLVLSRPARAQYTYEFAEAGTFSSSFTVAQGSTVAVQVYLVGTNSAGNNNLASNGLSSGGVGLQYATNGPFTIPGASSNNPNIVGNPAFGNSNNSVVNGGNGQFGTGNTSTATVQNTSFGTPVYPSTTDANGNNAVLLGTFTFTGVSPASGTTIAVTPSSVSNVDGAGNALDSMITSSSFSITVTAVPEPGSLMLTSLAASVLGLGVWKRRRKPLAAQVA